MPVVKKLKNGWVVISEFTGQPMIEKLFKERRQAQQAARELGQQGRFFF